MHKEECINYAKEELSRINLMDTPIGNQIIDFIETCYTVGDNNLAVVKTFMGMVERIVDKKPLSFLYEEELIEDKNGILYHPRYPHVKKINGVFVDEQAIAFINNDGSKWYGTNGRWNSTLPITFPYFPEETIVNTGE